MKNRIQNVYSKKARQSIALVHFHQITEEIVSDILPLLWDLVHYGIENEF